MGYPPIIPFFAYFNQVNLILYHLALFCTIWKCDQSARLWQAPVANVVFDNYDNTDLITIHPSGHIRKMWDIHMENYPLDPSLCIMLFVKHFCVLPITMPGGGIQLHLPKQNKNFRFETFIPKIGLYKFKRTSKQIGTIHKNAICYFFGGERRIIGESPKNCHACPPLEVPLNAHFFSI